MKDDIVWRDVVGFEGRYKVSNYGDIMSLFPGARCLSRRGILKPQNMKGTWAVQLRKDMKSYSISIAHAVAQAFLYPDIEIDDISIVRHLDGDLFNCAVDNLQVYLQPSAQKKITNTVQQSR